MKQAGKKTFGLGLTATVLVLAIVLGKVLSGNSQGTITNPPPAKPAAKVTNIPVSGHYISFSYPRNFGASPTDKPTGVTLETFAYIKRPSPFYFLNISVSSLISGNLADDGSYNSRLSQPARYNRSTLLVNGQSVDVFSDTSSAYAKAAWLAHGGKDVSVALSANASDDNLDTILAAVLNSLSWR